LGRRIGKTVNNQMVGFVYDGAQAIAEIIGSAITATYLTGLQLDEVLARYAGTGNKSLLTDALGSVIAQANDQQGIQNFYAYTPYGEAQALGPDDNNPIQYTARENDQTGLYFYRARYYDPVLKRFISEDPIGLNGGLNVYRYVRNSPLRFIDPLGLTTFSVGIEGSFQQTAAGASQSYSLGFSTSGQVCVQTTTCGRLGPGEAAGTTIVGSIGKGNFCEGNSATLGFFAEGGEGLFGGVSFDVGSEGVSVNVNFNIGVGGGAAAGSQVCITRTKCLTK
jgi:RHS repeat-associated protein